MEKNEANQLIMDFFKSVKSETNSTISDKTQEIAFKIFKGLTQKSNLKNTKYRIADRVQLSLFN